MNMYNMKLEQFQVNTKFLNTLSYEWSKFVTDVKLVRDLHTTNLNRTSYQHHQSLYQQSQFQPQATSYQSLPYATTYYNSQFVSPRPSSLTHSISYPGTDTSSLVNHNAYMASSSAPQIVDAPMDQQSSEYSPPEAGLVGGIILLRLVRQDHLHQDKEEHRANKALSRVTTAKAKVTCPNSAQNPRGSLMLSGSRIKFYWFKLKQMDRFCWRRS
uniref:Uncharacterized protein n=1 Tax=Tanacetum cinerariifolium TaxID=118510 RepID=A0A699R917_TANCI|nr:hypothetical protein [Tanacetum cinerariifolium]